MKTIVIYHSADFDGIFCREIARKFLPDAELIGWDYGQPVPSIPKGVQLYMLDISIDGLMTYPGLIWIDHHKSAIERYDNAGWIHEPAGKDSFGVAYNEFWRKGHEARTQPPPPQFSGYRIDGVAACRLAWQWFSTLQHLKDSGYHNPNATMLTMPVPSRDDFIDRNVEEPLAVRLAGEYDIWDKRDPDAELFQHGLRSQDLNDNMWDLMLVNQDEHSDGVMDAGTITVRALLDAGRVLQYARTQENASIIKEIGFTFNWEGLAFLACNAARYNSHLFFAGLEPFHDACFGFKWTGKDWSVSLYHAPGKEHHDLSLIAVKYGGGGHKGACGFRTKTLPFLT